MSINGCEIDDNGSTERAVAPVIGIILMVAIAVVLAGVIGIMVFGIADDLGDATPSATLTIDDVEVEEGDVVFTLSHDGGDSVTVQDVDVIINGTTIDSVYAIEEESNGNLDEDDELSAGESITLTIEGEGVDEDGTITISHAPSDSVLGDYEIQSNDIVEDPDP